MRIRHKARSLSDIDLNFVAAEAEYRRALELAPQNAGATRTLAILMARLGRLDEAVALDASGRLRSTRYAAQCHHNLALNLTALGRYDEAEAALRKAIELQPQAATNYAQLAIIQILRGKSGSGRGIRETGNRSVLAHLRTGAGPLCQRRPGGGRRGPEKLIDENADDGASQIAQVYALRKEPDKMFEWLEHGWPTNDPGVDRAADRSLPARLQGRPALHRLRAKGRGHAESRHQSVTVSN